MANEINSVAGQLWGIPMDQVYTAGTGIKIDNVHKIISLDETVLWKNLNNTTQLYSGTTYFNLSESFLNFDRIRVYFKHSYSTCFDSVEGLVPSSSSINLPVSGGSQGDNNNTMFDRALFAFSWNDALRCKVLANTRAKVSITNGSITAATDNAGVIPLMIVGINRRS